MVFLLNNEIEIRPACPGVALPVAAVVELALEL